MRTEQIWASLSGQLLNFLRQKVSDEQVAADLLQETFVRIHKGLAGLDDERRVQSWVFQIARNLVIDHYRAQARDAAALAADLQAEAAEDNLNVNEEVAGWLPHMIAQLPDDYREAVELYELKGMSQREIAGRLGVSLSGAKSRVQRGRDRLKALLTDCCWFERDRRGNFIDYAPRDPGDCDC